ncbi:hypothetical protein ACFL1Q_02800 [Patescibacteria group bacterium]
MKKKNLPKYIKTALILASIFAAVFLIDKQTHIFSSAFGQKADLIIDAGSSYKVSGDVWKNLAQGGEEKGRTFLPVIDKVKPLQPQYIRIDHIYDFYNIVSRDSASKLSYNWNELDLVIGDILATGAKPFISLSYMPPAISRGDIIDIPNSWNDWQSVVKATVEHISGKSGLGISNVYYEVWNEPDLFGKFKTYGEKNYLDLYYHSATGASKATGVLPFKIGGPATTGLYRNWFNSLLNYTAKNNLRLDFYSWHRYSMKINDYERDWLNAFSWLGSYPGYSNLEFVITEAGPNSETDPVNDGGFGAIHLIASSAVLEGNIGKMFTFEVKDGPGPEKYWGRWGILTHEKFGTHEPKPRYRALMFLNNMRGEKVNLSGQGSWIKAFARKEGNKIRVLVVNYDPYGRHSEATPLRFINLPYTDFILKRIDFGGKSRESKEITDDLGSWSAVEYFDPNSAAIFEVVPQR